MPRYMLLLQQSPSTHDGASPEKMQKIIQKYTDWRRRLEAEDRYHGGKKLCSSGRCVSKSSGEVAVTDGPFPEGKEMLAGSGLASTRGSTGSTPGSASRPASLTQSVVLSLVFQRMKKPGSIGRGAFIFAGGAFVFLWSSHVIGDAAKCGFTPKTTFIAIETVYLAVQFLLFGVALTIVHRALDPAVR